MIRRQVLALGGIGTLCLTGCLGDRDDPTGNIEPTYADHDFYFGLDGYTVDVDTAVEVDEDAEIDVRLETNGDVVREDEAVQFELVLENGSDEPLTIETGAPRPFGIVSLSGVDAERRLTLWSDAYEKSSHVGTTDDARVTWINDVALRTEVEPGEAVSETYTLSAGTHGIAPGSYEWDRGVGGWVGGEGLQSDESWTADVDVTVDVEPIGDGMEAGERQRDVLVVANPDDEDLDGEWTVTALEPVTGRHPGLVELTIESGWDEQRRLSSPRGPTFGPFVGESDEGSKLVLLPKRVYAPGLVANDCWESAVIPTESDPSGAGPSSIDPGEVIETRYVVCDHPANDDCFPPEEYTVELPHSDEVRTTADGDRIALDFTLRLDDR